MCIESVMPSNHLILCHPLLLLPSIFPSIRVFSNESVLCIRWPKYWSFSFNISLSNEYSGLISFRMDWLDLLAVQGTLKSLLQHQSSKASILWCSAFFIVQLSHLYMTTGKTIALTIWTFVGKVVNCYYYSKFMVESNEVLRESVINLNLHNDEVESQDLTLNQPYSKACYWDFPGSPTVKTLYFQYMGYRFDPWSGK